MTDRLSIMADSAFVKDDELILNGENISHMVRGYKIGAWIGEYREVTLNLLVDDVAIDVETPELIVGRVHRHWHIDNIMSRNRLRRWTGARR